jgi:uncharacterized membrane protein YfhO
MTGQDAFFSMDTALFKEVFDRLSKGNMEIESFSDEQITGTVNVPEGNDMLFTSIVFDEGWIVTVDGETKPLIKTNDSLLAVSVGPGTHSVSFRYLPKCFTRGSAVTVFGLLAFGGAVIWDEIRKRRELKKWAEENMIF